MDSERKPTPFPPPVEDDDEDEAPKSTLPDAVVEREAQKAIEEIDDEVEKEHPSHRAPPIIRHEGSDKTFVDKAWEAQYKVENRFKRFGHGRYGRVIKMARKPEPEEFAKASQITGIGILVVGFIGFLILLLVGWIMGLLNVK